MFKNWGRGLEGVAEVCAIQLPGREGRFRESLLDTAEPLVEIIARLVVDSGDRRPYVFFGHSLGAALCLRVAHELNYLQAEGPVGLILSARSPHVGSAGSIDPDRLDDDELLARVRGFGGISAAMLLNDGLMRSMIPRLRSDLRLSRQLEREQIELPPLATPIAALGGRDDPVVTAAELKNWLHYTSNVLQIRCFPGGHFFLRDESTLFAYLPEILRQFHVLTEYACAC